MIRPLMLLAGLLLSVPADAGRRNPVVVEDALAFALTDRTKSALLLEDALAHHEGYKPAQRALVMVHAAEHRRLLGDYRGAREWFTRAVSSGGRGWEIDAARLGLALVDAVDGFDPAVLDVLHEVREKDALATMNADRYFILTVRAARQNDAPSVRSYSRLALQYAAEDPEVEERIRAHIAALADAGEVLEFRPVEEPVELLSPMSDWEQAELALEAGDAERVEELVARLREGELTEAQQVRVDYLLRRIDAVPVRPDQIGVLLPLTERYQAAATQVQTALAFGFAAGRGRARLVIVDSGATPESAVLALERLVLEQGVIAVIGPLLSDEAEPVAAAADALGVPLIGLSQALDPGVDRSWVFQAMVSPQVQVEALVQWVMAERDLRAFAVFAPDNNYGRTATEAFTEAARQRGGEVTVVEYYDPESTDLIEHASRLGRKDYEARRWEFEKLKEAAEDTGANPDRVVLPPEIDFDALFLPDNASRIPLAAAALAYEEFPLGGFRTTKDGDTLPMLGLSGWNNPALISQGGEYVKGALFTEAFWPESDEAKDFERAYEADAGRKPTPLEAVTVDAGRLVAAASTAGPRTRREFRAALVSAEATRSITGATAFDRQTRTATRTVHILTIADDRIRRVGQVPASEPEVVEPSPDAPE